MERMMTHNIKKDILYYGIYSTADDMWNGSDVLCAARKRFFETGSRQKKRSTIKTDNVTYSYHYAIENGVLLKYKKTKGGQTVEWVVETPDGYYVEQLNDQRQPVKRTYYQRQHLWQRTEYWEHGMITLTIMPEENDTVPALRCQYANRTDILYPFDMSFDRELTQKLNVMTTEPPLFCVTDCGSFYFCTEKELQIRKKALEQLLQDDRDVQEEIPPETPLTGGTAFVVNSDFLQQRKTGGFDLRNSQEIRLSSEETVSAITADNDVTEEAPSSASVPAEKSPEETVSAITADNDVMEAAPSPAFVPAEESPEESVSAITADNDIPEAAPSPEFVPAEESPEETVSAITADNDVMGEATSPEFVPAEESAEETVSAITADNDVTEEAPYSLTAYEGDTVQNQQDGFGVYSAANGSVLVGQWQSGQVTGVISHFDSQGNLLYTGDTSKGQRSGTGMTYNHEDGTYFVGKYKDGVFLETGTQFDSDGNLIYTGGYRHNARNGEGIAYTPDGRIYYRGQWLNGRFHGFGILYDEGETCYIGMFQNGQREGRINEIHGQRVYRQSLYANDERVYTCEYGAEGFPVYYGSMNGNERSGMGCSFGEHAEKQFEGIFRHNRPEKAMRVFLKELSDLPPCSTLDGTEYERYRLTPAYIIEKNITVHGVQAIYSGRLKDGLPDGSGTILYADHRYTGYFSEGNPTGEGILYLYSGEECRGYFSAHAFEGCQTIVLSDITYFYRQQQDG